jgi:hypothetical protein
MNAWWRLREFLGFSCKHDWFPNHPPREFIVTTDVCMHCDATRVLMPYGPCLGGHPIAEHFNAEGRMVTVPNCTTKGPC